MKQWTIRELEDAGYKIENALISFVDLSMEDHECLTLKIVLKGNGWGCVYGGYKIGSGYLNAEEFKGSASGLESIMRIMDAVGSSTFKGMEGKYVRVAVKGCGDSVKIIGNIIEDKWFDIASFYADKNE